VIRSQIKPKAEQANYLNEWTWKKPVANQNKDYFAEVLCQHNVESMDISIVIKNKKGDLVGQQLIIQELPDEFAYDKHLGRFVWQSNEEVALISLGEKQEWRISLNSE
jgi:hypothetical protein